MTHSNHNWTNDTPALPEALGDRYYAQDLNDDFNYLKHLPYEALLQGRTRAVVIPPEYTLSGNNLSLTGGIGVIAIDTPVLDIDEDFSIPPKTTSNARFERVEFKDSTLSLPDDNIYFLVATVTKKSLLQRTKSLLSESYASRIKYEGTIGIIDRNTTIGNDQIFLGMISASYLTTAKCVCLVQDLFAKQDKNTNYMQLKFGSCYIDDYGLYLPNGYYNSTLLEVTDSVVNIDTTFPLTVNMGKYKDCIINVLGQKTILSGGIFENCKINYLYYNANNSDDTTCLSDFKCKNCEINVSQFVIGGSTVNVLIGGNNGVFENCKITTSSAIANSRIIGGGTFKNCTISINTVNWDGYGVSDGAFNNCDIIINAVNGTGIGIYKGVFNNCNITINTVNANMGNYASGIIGYGAFNKCIITIDTVNSAGVGIGSSTFIYCIITINTVNGVGVENSSSTVLRFTYISCSSVTNLNSTGGKLNILNNAVLHTS